MSKCEEAKCSHSTKTSCAISRAEYPSIGVACSAYWPAKRRTTQPDTPIWACAPVKVTRGGALCWLMVLALVFLEGCSGGIKSGTARAVEYREEIVEMGAALSDDALNSAEFIMCYGASIGSIRRKFGTPERVAVWQELCSGGQEFAPLTPVQIEARQIGSISDFSQHEGVQR